jgi:hypothetical protein
VTATLPDGMEFKDMAQACADAVSTGVWGSEHPDEHGVRNHIVAVTGVRDEVGDIIVPGAFIKTLQRLTPKACIGHDWNRAIGDPVAIEEVMPGDPRLPREDRFGKPWPAKAGALFARTRYNLDKKDGQDAYSDAVFYGPKLATSIGYIDPKDDNGKPLHSYKAVDPDTGLMTRFLPELQLFEYSQVLHGAHLLAGGIKHRIRPQRMERKQQRPDMELKIRLVRDSAYWGMPLGTPIRPGMKPQGPKARRLVAAGQQADVNAGAVEVDANNLRIKSTAKGKLKGPHAVATAYSGVISLFGSLGEHNPNLATRPDGKPVVVDPFDDASFVVEDSEAINKGGLYNPLDILVANAEPPAELEEQLRDNSDWDSDRLGDAAARQDEIDSFVADVVDAYREKYNAELVRQNDTGDSEVAEGDGTAEVQPSSAEDARTVNEQEEDRRYQTAADRAAQIPAQEQQRAQSQANREAVRRGEIPLRPGAPAATAEMPATAPVSPTRISPEDQAEMDRLKRDGRDNEAAKLYREAVQRARAAGGVTPGQTSPNRPADGPRSMVRPPSLEDGRTMQVAEPLNSDESRSFELVGANGATLRVYDKRTPADPAKPWTYDIITADGETIEGESTFRSPGSALVRAEGEFHEAERGQAAADAKPTVPPATEPVSVPNGEGDGNGLRGYAIPPPPVDDAATLEQADSAQARLALHNGDPVSVRENDGVTANVYNMRTEQAYDVPVSELLTGGASPDAPVTLKLNDAQREAADLVFGNGEPIGDSGAELTGSGLLIADVAEAINTIDTRMEIFEDNPDQKRRHGRVIKALRAKIAKLARPGDPVQAEPGVPQTLPDNGLPATQPSAEAVPEEPSGQPIVDGPAIPEAGSGVGRFADGSKPSPKLIAALGNAIQVTGMAVYRKKTADGWMVSGHANTLYPLMKKKLGVQAFPATTEKGLRTSVLLNEEGARLMAPYLPGGGQRGGQTPESMPGNGLPAASPSTEAVPEGDSGESIVDPVAAPEQPVAPTDADITSMVTAKPDVAAARAAQMSDGELAAFDAAMSDRAAELGKPGQRTPGHQAVADELARRSEAGAAPEQGVPAADGAPGGELDSATPPDDELVEDVGQAQAEAIAENEVVESEQITVDEIADADEIVDAGFGLTEAPDGEFEVDADIADRQDRVASLLMQAEAGSLDLTGAADDQLRGTRADLVDELRLQQHLERRRAGERAVTRQQTETQAVDDLVPQEADDTGPAEQPGPKPRPGVAGAAEDLADALESGDDDRADAAVERFRKALARSRSDSAVVEELHAMLAPESGAFDPVALRDAAQRLRDEQRAKRNEGARRRRTARRFERERLRALLGQVEAEMRNRDLDYDPIPDEDGNVTLELATTPPVTWSSVIENESWSGGKTRIDELNGANYSARIVVDASPEVRTRRPPEYRWTVTSDDGTVLATGKNTAPDMDSARASVEIALDTQRRLGLIPVDAQIPQGSVSEDISATPHADVVGAIQNMRQRIVDGRALNPITGRPDPLNQNLPPLPAIEPIFGDADAARKYLERRGEVGRSGGKLAESYRWDTAKLTPGAGLAVIDDLNGRPHIVHTRSGATLSGLGMDKLNRADLLRYATIAEATPDVDGNLVDWRQNGKELAADIRGRRYESSDGGLQSSSDGGLQATALNRLTREKIAAGAFTHPLVQRSTERILDATNPTRVNAVADQHRALAQLINVRTGKPTAFDKKTIDTSNSAHTLAYLGAPDAAAALLTRRAAEIREQHGDDPGHGAPLLDAMARGYLGMFSPVRSHGERVGAIKAGERLFLQDRTEEGGEPKLRSFRALAPLRNDPRGGPSEYLAPVIDEKTGDQRFLRVSISEFRIEDTDDIRYGFNPLSANRGSGMFAVVGPGEERPDTVEDLQARAFDDAAAIPQDVLDAAAEALPESKGETAARRAAAEEGRRAPRRGTPRAPTRAAQPPAAPVPVRGEQQLAEAQGRTLGKFLGMPFEYGDAPVNGTFADLDAVREHLVTLEGGTDLRVASSARAVIADIDSGALAMSPGGVFAAHKKTGTVTHLSSGQRVWPPQPGTGALEDLEAGGYKVDQAAGLRVARALESGVFDGEQIDWSGDGSKAVKQTNVISKRNGGFHPLMTAQRAAFLDGVLGTPKPPRATDKTMFIGMANGAMRFEAPNAEAFDESAVRGKVTEYEGFDGYTADSKAGATLSKRIAAELRVAMPMAKTAPLDAVRRLTRMADELDGQTVEMRAVAGPRDDGWRGAMARPTQKSKKTLTPSDDLRRVAAMITDVYDPGKISNSGRFRQAGMVGQVEFSKPRISTGRTWQDPNGVAARKLETQIKDAGGLRFYRDENGMLHATFAGVDIADGQHNGRTYDNDSIGLSGAIKLDDSGRLTVSYTRGNQLMIIEGVPGSWSFTPEQDEDTESDSSGSETESSQVGQGAETDTDEDIGDIEEDEE